MRSLSLGGNGLAATATDRRLALLDVAGGALFAAAGGWMLWARLSSAGSAAPGISLLAACALVIAAARGFGQDGRLIVPAAGLIAAVVVVAGSRTSVVSLDPLSGPFRYLNADGAFYVQAAIAGLMVAWTARSKVVRVGGAVGALGFAVLPFLVHALAAATLVILLPGIVLVAVAVGHAGGAKAAIGILGALFVASVAATIILAATFAPGATASLAQRAAFGTVDRERVALWHDAFVIMRDHPGTGVGPGRYQVVSPIGSTNRDDRWAHNEFLQQGAEGGIPGMVLLLALFGWGFVRLWAVRGADVLKGLAAASLAALGIHASIDYILHFPAIPVLAAAIVATGMLERTTNPSDATEERPAERNDLAASSRA